jgi:hypothetical protein
MNSPMVPTSVCDQKLLDDSAQLSSLGETSNGTLKKARRRRPNVSSCDDEEEDRLNFQIISPQRHLDFTVQPGDPRGDIQYGFQIPSTKFPYGSVSQDLFLSPSCLTAMNHFNRILHGSSSSAFVPLRK